LCRLFTSINATNAEFDNPLDPVKKFFYFSQDWMFSYPIERGLPPTDYPYDLVDTQRGSPQGRLFPSDLVEDHSFDSEGAYSTIKPWYSEGDLVTETTSRIGVNKTIEAFVAHRDRYWTDADLKLMSSKGINTVRPNPHNNVNNDKRE